MQGTVDFLMVTNINEILKKNHIEYSVHTYGGCYSCGLVLRLDGKEEDLSYVLGFINEYLASKWLVASLQSIDDGYIMLYIDSKFDLKKDK